MSKLKKCQYCIKSYPSKQDDDCCPYTYSDKERRCWKDCRDAIRKMMSIEKKEVSKNESNSNHD